MDGSLPKKYTIWDKLSCLSLYIFLSFWGNERRQKPNIPHHNHLGFFDLGGHDHLVTIILAAIVHHSHLEKTSWGVNQSSLFKRFLFQNCMKIDRTTLFLFKIIPLISAGPWSEFHTPLHKKIITLKKFNIPISIDNSIKTHKFVCIRQN